jgi:hypothetical protein
VNAERANFKQKFGVDNPVPKCASTAYTRGYNQAKKAGKTERECISAGRARFNQTLAWLAKEQAKSRAGQR